MKLREARAAVLRAIRPMKAALGLNRWGIDILYDETPFPTDVNLARLVSCEADSTRFCATVVLYTARLEDEKALCETLRHELLHIVCAETDVLTREIGPMLRGDEAEDVCRRLVEDAQERTVSHLEYLLDQGVRIGVPELLRRGKKQLNEWKPGR
jgi:hypothetical protein